MEGTASPGGGGAAAAGSAQRATKVNELALLIRNNPKVHAIVSAHRDDVLSMFKKDEPATRMVALRIENLSAMKFCISASPSKLPPSLPSVLQELLVKAEEEAMTIYNVVNEHRASSLAVFRNGAPASKLVTLRLENLERMKKTMAFGPTNANVLQDFLVTAEEEAMKEFHRVHSRMH